MDFWIGAILIGVLIVIYNQYATFKMLRHIYIEIEAVHEKMGGWDESAPYDDETD